MKEVFFEDFQYWQIIFIIMLVKYVLTQNQTKIPYA